MRGHGNKIAADQAAVDAMRRELNKMPIDGTIVIGEGERDKAPMLFIGEKVGNSNGPKVDIAVDPLDGTTSAPRVCPVRSHHSDGGGWHAGERTRRTCTRRT